MIFIANCLPLNGGSTFLIRMCREYSSQNKRPGVLIIFNQIDSDMYDELSKWANIFFLSDYSYIFLNVFFKNQVGGFLPLKYRKLEALLIKHNHQVHLMGIFGLLLIARLLNRIDLNLKVTVGIYHQNEFMFNGINSYFSKISQKYFGSINPRAIIFFNESSRVSHSKFFNLDYNVSGLLPVGITLSNNFKRCGSWNSKKIVSIGNLYNFKTYNKHIINAMPFLLGLDSRFTYEIYGYGPCENELKNLAISNGVENSVFFNGKISYESMPNVLQNSFVFIGSGTALVEAASFGVPSIIGIESSPEPITYGFFDKAIGFSYHEFDPERETVVIRELIESIVSDEIKWHAISSACREKSYEFSITKTCDGFLNLHDQNIYLDRESFKKYSNVKAFFSVLFLYVKETISGNKKFSNRRNQGTIV